MEMQKLLELLACPICHGELELVEKDSRKGLLCKKCDVVFPIEDDIPVLLPEAAIPQSDWPKEAGK